MKSWMRLSASRVLLLFGTTIPSAVGEPLSMPGFVGIGGMLFSTRTEVVARTYGTWEAPIGHEHEDK